MGIDLRDRSLGDSHRRPACPVVAPWARELIRPLGKRTGARRVSIWLTAGPYRHHGGGPRAKALLCEPCGEKRKHCFGREIDPAQAGTFVLAISRMMGETGPGGRILTHRTPPV